MGQDLTLSGVGPFTIPLQPVCYRDIVSDGWTRPLARGQTKGKDALRRS